MRLFVGVWPTDDVRAAIATIPRPAGARWTVREQWHVTLRFLGEVHDPEPWMERVRAVAAAASARTITLGPRTTMLGRENLVLPAAGVDDLAAVLGAEQFRGHLTLARRATHKLAGHSFTASWQATELALIRSHLGGGPARYETLATGAFAP